MPELKTFQTQWSDPVAANATNQTVRFYINNVAIGGASPVPLNTTSAQKDILVSNGDEVKVEVVFFNSAGSMQASLITNASVATVNPPSAPVIHSLQQVN